MRIEVQAKMRRGRPNRRWLHNFDSSSQSPSKGRRTSTPHKRGTKTKTKRGKCQRVAVVTVNH